MESMIKLDGATLLFPTSFGYFEPYTLKMAAKYKIVELRHCGGLRATFSHPYNLRIASSHPLRCDTPQR
jgi:basic membrane protein A and related proteins